MSLNSLLTAPISTASYKKGMEYLSVAGKNKLDMEASLNIDPSLFGSDHFYIATNEISLPEFSDAENLSDSELKEKIFLQRIITIFMHVQSYNANASVYPNYIYQDPESEMGIAEYPPLGICYGDIIDNLKLIGSITGNSRNTFSYIAAEYPGRNYIPLPIALLVFSENGNPSPKFNDCFLLIEDKCYKLNECSSHMHLITTSFSKPATFLRKIFGDPVAPFQPYDALVDSIYEFHDDYAEFMQEVKIHE